MQRLALAITCLSLAAFSGACGEEQDPTFPNSVRTGPSTAQGTASSAGSGPASEGAIRRSRAALNQIVAECTKRRSGDDRVGRVSRRFGRSVDTLITEFKRHPDEEIRLREGEGSTTLRAVLRRVSTSLRQKAPDGCGGNTSRSNTTELADEIQEALRETRG